MLRILLLFNGSCLKTEIFKQLYSTLERTWGWDKNYVNVLAKKLGGKLLSSLDLGIWFSLCPVSRIPILGDGIYGVPDKRFPQATLMLHARTLAITLPGQNAPSLFKAPLPERFRQFILAMSKPPEGPRT
jgi:hypothetical protein